MTGLVRKTLTLAAGLAVVASVATAGVPDPRNCTVDVVCVGNTTGALIDRDGPGADRAGFDVTVKDVNNAALANRTVVVDWSATTVKLYSAQNAGTTVNCAAKTLSRLTNASGDAIFGPRMGLYANTASVEVRADGVVLGSVRSRSTDINGVSAATNTLDLALFRGSFLGPDQTEHDFNNDAVVNSLDLALFRPEFLSGVTGAYCP